MGLNNKGFAITGILYTLFVLFLMILASILGALSSRKNMLERSTAKLEEGYLGSTLKSSEYINSFNTNKVFPVTGRYKFSFGGGDAPSSCVTYVKGGTAFTDLNSVDFTSVGCNEYKPFGQNVTLVEVVSFEEE